jgi:hypothetical protein
MTIELIDLILRFASGGILLLFALLLLRDRRREVDGWLGIAVIACCGAFLITSSNPLYREGTIDTALRQLAALTPAMIWIAVHEALRIKRGWHVPAACGAFAMLGLARAGLDLDESSQLFAMVHGLAALCMLGDGGVRAALHKDGLRAARIQFAFIAIVFAAVVAYVDPISHGFDLPLATELLASAATFSFAFSVAFSTVALPGRRRISAEEIAFGQIVQPGHSTLDVPANVVGEGEERPKKAGRRA